MSPVKRDSKCRQIQKHLESWICQQILLPILIIGMELGKFDRFTRAIYFFTLIYRIIMLSILIKVVQKGIYFCSRLILSYETHLFFRT